MRWGDGYIGQLVYKYALPRYEVSFYSDKEKVVKQNSKISCYDCTLLCEQTTVDNINYILSDVFLINLYNSIVLYTQRDLQMQCRENESQLENVLLEVQRLWPPFAGGRRVAIKVILTKLFFTSG